MSDINSPEALYLRDQLLRWFDFWLKGIDTGIMTEPRVTVAPEKTAQWSEAALINADTFPLPGTTTTTYYFNGKRLSTVGAAGNPRAIAPTTASTSIISPIRNVLGASADELIAAIILVNNFLLNSGGGILDPGIVTRPDNDANAKTFISKPLASDTKVIGLPEFHLFVSARAAEAYYYVQIFEISSNGTPRLITRGAFKDHASDFSAAHEIDFSPFAINHTFKAGNRISVRVASRDFPFFLPNLSQPKIFIYRDAGNPSNVTLPVVP
jgi:hypothetical protein